MGAIRLDGKTDWPVDDQGAHPLTELLLADFLVVDTSKPFSDGGDSDLEIERAVLTGRPSRRRAAFPTWFPQPESAGPDDHLRRAAGATGGGSIISELTEDDGRLPTTSGAIAVALASLRQHPAVDRPE